MDNSETFKSFCLYITKRETLLNPFPWKLLNGTIHWIISLGSIFSSPACYTRCLYQILLTLYLEIHKWMKVCSDILLCYLLLWFSCSVVSDTLQPRGRQPPRLLYSWDLPGKNTGVGCCALLQGFLPTLGRNRISCKFLTTEPPEKPLIYF